MLQLIVQPAQNATCGAGMVVLHEVVVNAGGGQCVRTVGFAEESSRIFMNLRLDDDDSRKRGLDYFQCGLELICERGTLGLRKRRL